MNNPVEIIYPSEIYRLDNDKHLAIRTKNDQLYSIANSPKNILDIFRTKDGTFDEWTSVKSIGSVKDTELTVICLYCTNVSLGIIYTKKSKYGASLNRVVYACENGIVSDILEKGPLHNNNTIMFDSLSYIVFDRDKKQTKYNAVYDKGMIKIQSNNMSSLEAIIIYTNQEE